MRRALLTAAMLLAAASPAGAAQFGVRDVSARPEAVSGGDALLEVDVPPGADPAAVAITVDGADVRDRFTADGPVLRGLVDTLAPGPNTVVATLAGYPDSRLYLVDHPLTGPIFSGTPQSPFTCRTNENGLGPPLDADCTAPTKVTFVYRTTAGRWAPLADPADPYPANGVTTTTRAGRTVPFAVRTERGTLARGVYTLSTLVDVGPGSDQARPGAGWNGKLSYFFGPGCNPNGAGFDQQVQNDPTTAGTAGDANVAMNLGKGFATGRSTMNVFGNRCFDAASAESLSMVKERFAEWAGVPIRATLGYGSSGGSTAQQMVANNYPGLLDGLHLSRSFTDNTNADALMDCGVVHHFLAGAAGWTTEQAQAVRGGGVPVSCPTAFGTFSKVFFAPRAVCPAGLPDGIRCSLFDANRALWGIDPDTGVARQPVDNVGEQYGLVALRDGVIGVDQFLDLNEGAGSVDVDGDFVPGRRTAPAAALRLAYDGGQFNEGGGGLAYTPVIDDRGYVDDTEANIHSITHALSMRARLVAANGGIGPQVIFTSPDGLAGGPVNDLLDEWAEAIRTDSSDRSQRDKALDAQPPAAADACFSGTTFDSLIAVEPAGYDSGTCGATFPSPRTTTALAGEPDANDRIKCRLKPIDDADYGDATFDAGQRARLEQVFPDGVCDTSAPGVGQVVSRDTWRAWPLSGAPDTTAPDTAIASAPRDGTGPVARFDFSATETGAQYACRLDGDPFAHCDPVHLVTGLADGPHRFEVHATDPAGNTDPTPAVASFVVGTGAPPQPSPSPSPGETATATPPAATPTPPPSATPSPAPTAAGRRRVTLRTRTARVRRHGRVRIAVRCTGGRCRGTAVLGAARGRTRYATTGFRLTPGPAILRLRLPRRARRHHRLRAQLTLAVHQPDGTFSFRTRTLTLRNNATAHRRGG